MVSHVHFRKPFPILDRKGGGSIFIHDIHRGKGPAVYFQSLSVIFRGVTISFIIGVGFHDDSLREIFFQQMFHPFSGDDIRSVGLAGMQLHSNLACNISFDFLIEPLQSLRRQVSGKINDGFISRTLLDGNVFLSLGSWCFQSDSHLISPFSSSHLYFKIIL